MKKSRLKNLIKDGLILILFFACIGEAFMIRSLIPATNDGVASSYKLKQLKSAIDKYYLEKIDEDQLKESTYKGLLEGLDDPYSVYYTKEEYEEMEESQAGIFSGIGATLTQNMDTKICEVVSVIPGSPAEKAGVKPGDIILKVDGKELTEEDLLANVVAKIKGEEGTKVKITFLRGKKEKEFTIVRKKIEVPTVESEMLDDQIGYIKINEFDEITVEQFSKALGELEQNGMQGFVLDLRNNPGGLLNSAVKISDMILGQGKIVYTKDKDGKKEEYKATSEEKVNVPMTVLINGNSASASEIVAGAIQDYKAGTIVGTTSFGKGIVQNIWKLSDGSAIKLTVSNYYTPKGRNIHKKGINPDVTVELKESLMDQVTVPKEKDNQLQKALQVLGY